MALPTAMHAPTFCLCAQPNLRPRTNFCNVFIAEKPRGKLAARKVANNVIVCRRSSGAKSQERRNRDGRRPVRIGEMIRREMSSIIDDAFSEAFDTDSSPPVTVNVVDVECSDDLRNARVNISVSGNDEQKSLVLKWLKNSRKVMRYELAQCIRMKYIPELYFGESKTSHASRIVSILDELAKEREEKARRFADVVEEVESVASLGKAPTEKAGSVILDDDNDGLGDIRPSYAEDTASISVDDISAGQVFDDDDDDFIVDIDDDDELEESNLCSNEKYNLLTS